MNDRSDFLYGLCAILVVVAMVAVVKAMKAPAQPTETEAAEQLDEFVDLNIVEITLSDGTRCAVMRFGGGIDCDWRAE